jgi:ferredoxin
VKLSLDTRRCQGHGRCFEFAPGLFDLDDDGHAVLLVGDGSIPPYEVQHVQLAVGNCPERALSLQP